MRRLAILVIILCSSSFLYAVDTTVVVINFVNYGGPGLDYLSSSIPESISSSLADIKGIRVVERRELGKLLDEIVLELGAVNTEDVERVGNLANAEVLILGSVSGNPNNVIVTMKAVQVATGNMLAENVVRSPIATLFDNAVIAARSIGIAISGQDVAKMSVYSDPLGATVYIDGIEVGNTPLEKYSVVAGEHKVLVVHDGYMDYQKTVTMAANTHEKLNPILIEKRLIRRNNIGVGVYYLVPLHDEVKPTVLINPTFYAYTVGILQPGVELAFALNQRHDMELISPLSTPFTMERQYNLIMCHAYINVLPFKQWRYVLPRVGVAVGLVHLWDYRINQVFEGDEELIISQTSFSLGGKIGVNFLPFSFFSIFLEARFYLQPLPVNRPTYVSQGLGSEMAQLSEETRLNYFAMGGGVKLAF